MGLKKCSKCRVEKESNLFSKDKTKKDGLRHDCKKCASLYKKHWHEQNVGYQAAYNQKYCEQNKEHLLDYQKSYYQKNKQQKIAYQYQYKKQRLKADPYFKIVEMQRTRAYNVMHGGSRPTSMIKAFGCTKDCIIKHLESKFYPNPETGEEMSWDNWTHDGWHIDHVIPLCAFSDLSEPKQFKKAWHYTNLQPLWAKDNMKKGSKT